MNSGDTAFMLVSAALVMLMTPGLALFYGGMVRSKNVLGTIMQNFILLGLISVLWAIYGYSLAFGPDVGHLIGNLNWVGLAGVGFEPFKAYSETIPHQTFMIYQAMFAIITPALITGAFAERLKFSTFLVFMVLWVTLVYCPVAHWVWGDGGWLKNLGALDFAGGTVVHINAGIAALAAALVVGKRQGYGNHATFIPHNLPMTILGAGLLWFGWFGFNAGSALAAGALAVFGLHGHAPGHRGRHPVLGGDGMDGAGQAHHPGRGFRRGGRAGGHHPGGGLCGSHVRHHYRPGGWGHLLSGGVGQTETGL